jgi:pimeloyl-ACP methyl ester carboxylesterase
MATHALEQPLQTTPSMDNVKLDRPCLGNPCSSNATSLDQARLRLAPRKQQRAARKSLPPVPVLEPLVLLHPFSLCPEVWHPIVPLLTARHRVISLGIPGHHGADPLPCDFDHSIEAAVDLLERKLDEQGIERAHLVGNSLGGWLAIELARRGRALSVVAIAPGGGWQAGSVEQRRLRRRFKVTRFLLDLAGPHSVAFAKHELARKIFLREAVAHPERLSAEDAALFIESAWRCTCFEGILEALMVEPPAPVFEALPCPVRVVWGEEDRLLPMQGYSEHWRRVLVGADWLTLRGVGHVPMYDDPEAVARAILEWTERAEQGPDRLAG